MTLATLTLPSRRHPRPLLISAAGATVPAAMSNDGMKGGPYGPSGPTEV
jgi:hypothetical protein